jgi:glutamate-1-semialdehyde 2,1-aminomutase
VARISDLRQTARYLSPDSAARQRLACARELLPDGITRETIRRAPWAPYMAQAHGTALVDLDGDERTDFLFNHTSLIHGHTYGPVVAAVSGQARTLEAIPFPSEPEAELARLLTGPPMPVSQPYIRFTSSGSEAVMLALRLAATATGRRKIVLFEGCYHGAFISTGTSGAASSDHLICPFNDPGALTRLIGRHGSQIAAVLADFRPVRGVLSPASDEFADAVKAGCERSGALLICDEVVSMRAAPGGMAAQYGLAPDVICLGKYIGGGLPIGAVVFRRELAGCFAPGHQPRLEHGGTYNGNPLSMAAGCAAMRGFTAAPAARLEAATGAMCDELRRVFRRKGAGWTVRHAGSLLHLWPHRELPGSPGHARQQPGASAAVADLSAFLLRHGAVIAPSGFGCLSTATTPEDMDYLAMAIDAYLTQ